MVVVVSKGPLNVCTCYAMPCDPNPQLGSVTAASARSSFISQLLQEVGVESLGESSDSEREFE